MNSSVRVLLIFLVLMYSKEAISQTITYDPAPSGTNIKLCEGGTLIVTVNGTIPGEIYFFSADPPNGTETLTATGTSLTFSSVTYSTSGTFAVYVLRTAPTMHSFPIQTISVAADPTAPTLTLSQPEGSVNAGTMISATLATAGSGGVTGSIDYYKYSIDGGTTWFDYTLGDNISTTYLNMPSVKIKTYRAHPNGLGCMSTETIYEWTVVSRVHDNSGPATGSYYNIQQAIDAANTVAGDILEVDAGTYSEGELLVNKEIKLHGANIGKAGNDNMRGVESVITDSYVRISAHNVEIDGFKFTGTPPNPDSHSTQIGNNNLVFIPNNGVIKNNFFNKVASHGVYLKGAENWTIENNLFEGIGNLTGALGTSDFSAMKFTGANNVTVQNNVVSTVDYNGILINPSNNVTITGNSFTDIRKSGFQVSGIAGGISVIGNTFTNANIDDETDRGAIRIYGQDFNGSVNITGNTITGGVAAFAVKSGQDITGKDIHFNNNEITGLTGAAVIRHMGTGTLDAKCNWFGSATYGDFAKTITGKVLFVPYQTSNGGSCDGANAALANLALTYTPASENVVLKFDVTGNGMELRAIPGLDPNNSGELALIAGLYNDLKVAIAGGIPAAIQDAALAIGDDIIAEYYYMDGMTKVYLQTFNSNDLIKNKYWQNYLIRTSDSNSFPDWANGISLVIPAEYGTSTNPGTGAVVSGWLNDVLGRDLHVDVTFIHNGTVVTTPGVVAIGAGPIKNQNTGLGYPTIQLAIDAATPGDVILVSAGTYSENIIINKAITLTGAQAGLDPRPSIGSARTVGGSNETIIVAAKNTKVIDIQADDVVINGFQITQSGGSGSADAVKASTSLNNIDFKYNIVANVTDEGIQLEAGNNYTIEYNYIFNPIGDGITLSSYDVTPLKGNNQKIVNNDITGSTSPYGSIYLYGTENVEVSGNIINTKSSGIAIGSDGLNVSNANIHNNEINTELRTAYSAYAIGISIDGSGENIMINNNKIVQVGTYSPPANKDRYNLIRVGLAATSNPSNVSINENNMERFDNENYIYVIPSVTNMVDATCNWWGTSVLGDIPVRISGTASFLPFWSTNSGPCDGYGPVVVYEGTSSNMRSSHMTIQEGIDAATAGDVIEVSKGTYVENIKITKDLSLLGPNATIDGCSVSRVDEAIILPPVSDITNSTGNGVLIDVQASNVTISGFMLDGDNPAINTGFISTTTADIDVAGGIDRYGTGDNLTITNNIIQNVSYTGIVLYDVAKVPSAGNVISGNLIQNLGTYDATSGISFWGLGILLHDNQYASVTDNCMVNVRLGIQTGRFIQPNPGTDTYQKITNNTISARRIGLIHNAQYSNASPFTLQGNSITGINETNESQWAGIQLSELSVPSTTNNNTIDGTGVIKQTTTGIMVWNVINTHPADITGGMISNVKTGIFVNNFEGYNTNAPDGAHANISGVNINASQFGVRVLDSPSSTTNKKVHASVSGCTIVSGAEGISTGEKVAGTTSASFADNIITSNSLGINVKGMTLSATNGLTINNNTVNITAQVAGTTPTVGISLSKILGDNAAVITDNTISGAHYGYLGYNINTDAVTEIQGGSISSVMQGVALVNTLGGPLAKTKAKVSGVNMNGFIGTSSNPDNNFHAGIYTYTAGTTTAATGIELALDGVSIDGTGVPAQNSGGINCADFSGNTSEYVQTIVVTNSSIINNANRGVDARGKVNLSISGSTLSNNGHTPFGTGNHGISILAQKDANVTAENNFISLPTGTTKVFGLLLGTGTTNLITANNNSILLNGNTNTQSKLAQASSGQGSIVATCNWWGSTNLGDNSGNISGNVTFLPWLSSGDDSDLGMSGFQTADPCTVVQIDHVTKTDVYCGQVGSIVVAFLGGIAPYDIAWTGGSATGVTSPYTITPLSAGTYNITVTSINGSTATTSATILDLPVTNTNGPTHHATIQAAIDAATAGDVINVCAGTYKENLLITKGISVIGAGRDMTIVTAAVGSAPTLKIKGNAPSPMTGNVLIEGLSFTDNDMLHHGFIVASDHIPTASKLTFKNNRVTNGDQYGWWDYHSHGEFVCEENIFSDVYCGLFLEGWDTSPVTVDGNEFTNLHAYETNGVPNPAFPAVGILMMTYSGGSGVDCTNPYLIKNNKFHTYATDGSGIVFYGGLTGNAAKYTNVEIASNEIAVGLDAIRLRNYSTSENDLTGGIENANIHNNQINGSNRGIYIQGTNPGTIANQNSIVGSVTNSILNTGSGTGANVDASCNWYDSIDPVTIASKISGAVTYIPFLTSGTDSNSGLLGFQTTEICSAPCDLVVSASYTEIYCGFTTSDIDITTTGGSGVYTYAWTGTGVNPTSEDQTGLSAGFYNVTVTDQNGCTVSTSVTILYLPVTNTTGPTYYATIQAAIDAATANDVIEVCAGTYTENINIDKQLDIRGANYNINPNDASWNPNASRVSESIIIGTVSWTGQGYSLNGFTLKANVNNSQMITLSGGTTGTISIANNIVSGEDLGKNALFVSTDMTLNVTNNTFKKFNKGNSNHALVLDGEPVGTYSGNYFVDNTNNGLIIQGSVATSQTISGNNFNQQATGIILGSGGHTITNNLFTNQSLGRGIYSEGGNNTITYNKFTNNNYALWVKTGSGDQVHHNVFLGGDTGGKSIYHHPTTNTLDATCNWWNTTVSYDIPAKFGGIAPAPGLVKFLPFSTMESPINCDGLGPVNVYSSSPTAPGNWVSSHMKIQEAINESTTINGYVIDVDADTFNEQVKVNKELTIKSAGASQAIVNFTGTVTGKPTLFDVTANNVTIENIHFNVDLSKLRSAIIASSVGLDNIVVNDNLIDAYGTPAGTYGDRNAVSVNYGAYRNASGGVNSVTFTGNTVNGTAPGSYFRSGISADEVGLTATGNTLTSINHDVLLRFSSNGASNISGNNFNGGGVELVDQNAGSGTITVSSNIFTGAGAPGTAMLRVKNNYHSIPHVISNNTFNNYDWAVSLENVNTVTMDQNSFNTTVTTAHAVAVNTKSISSNSSTIVQVPVSATFTKNDFNGTGNAITFLNHDSDNDSYGSFTLGSAGNENNFANTLSSFVVFDGQTGPSDNSTFPDYASLIGTGGTKTTTMACWDQNLDASNNKFDVGSGLQLPSAMNFAERTSLDAKLTHNPDNSCLGVITYFLPVHNITQSTYYLTIGEAVAAASPSDVIECSEWTFNERVVIDKSLTLQGVDSANVVITGTGLGNGRGIQINNGVTGVTIQKLTVKNFNGASGNGDAGIYAIGGNNNLVIHQVAILDNVGGSGFYANGPVNGVSITNVTSTGHTVGARGIVIWNGLKENITISNCHVYGNNCCGIELQDGTATGVTITNNNVHDNGDNGMGLTGIQGPGVNVVSDNTITDNGRYGIEIKNPNGSGTNSGAGSILVSNNTVSRTTVPGTEHRDLAGIAVFRRGVLAGNVDVPYGVYVSGNSVSGFAQPDAIGEGYGIVLEGINHTAINNTLNGNDIGIQRQAGNTGYPGDANQNETSDYFGRGNSPVTCGVTISGNVFANITANLIDTRDVGNSDRDGIVVNTNINKSFCSIQAAIDDVNTLDGHTIEVSADTYAEHVIVNKALDLRGPNYGISGTGVRGAEALIVPEANLMPSDPWTEVVFINANNVSFDGFKVSGDNPAISGYTYAGMDLEKGLGVYSEGNNVIFKNNIVEKATTMGFFAGGGLPTPQYTDITVTDNKFENIHDLNQLGYGFAMYIQATTGEVSNNTVLNSRSGIQVQPYRATQNMIAPVVNNNTFNVWRSGIYYNYAENGATAWTISGNTVNAITPPSTLVAPVRWQGIAAETIYASSNGGTITGNTVNGNNINDPLNWWAVNGMQYASSASTSNNVNFTNNTVTGVKTGFVHDAAADIVFTGNNLTASEKAISVQRTYNSAGVDQGYGGTNNIDATGGNTYNSIVSGGASTAQLLTIEDAIDHKIDESWRGLVRVKTNELFVTTNSYIAPGTTTPLIQRGVDAATAGNTLHVGAGTYTESASVNKALTILGSNSNISPNTGVRVSESIISPTNSRTFTIATGNTDVTISGFKFVGGSPIHDGNGSGQANSSDVTFSKNLVVNANAIYAGANSSWADLIITDNKFEDINATSTASAMQVSGTSTTTITDNTFNNVNYAAILIDATPMVNISGNNINGTGAQAIQLAGAVGSATVENNKINDANRTLQANDRGAIRLYGSGFTGIVSIRNNEITGGYNGVTVRNGEDITGKNITVTENSITGLTNGKSIYHGGTGVLSATCNWYGTTDPLVVNTQISGDVNFLPFGTNGMDDNASILGFQPVAGSCDGTGPVKLYTDNTLATLISTHITIQSAVDAASSGNTIVADAGTYAENVTVNKSLDIRGPHYGVPGNDMARGTGEAIVVPAITAAGGEIFMVKASNVSINGFTIDGDNTALTSGWIGTNGADIDAGEGVTIYDASPVVNNLVVSNNIIQNLGYYGVTLFGASNYSDANTSKTGHEISYNLIRDMGYYGTGNGYDKWGGGVLLYNSHYAHVANNTMTNVRIGIQTGNFQTAHIGTDTYRTIENNTIEARLRGIFYNLQNYTPLFIKNNTITGLYSAVEESNSTGPWRGMLLSSLGNNMGQSNISGNNIDGTGLTYSKGVEGINVWNVNTNSPANITGGSIIGVETGVFLNNFEGYNSDATAGAHATISGVTINASEIGVRVLDSPSSTSNAKVNATVTGCAITSGAEGIRTEESVAGSSSASLVNNTITAGAVGINVTGMTLSPTNGLTIDNNTVGLTSKLAGTNPTVGINLSKILGTNAAVITDNKISGAHYGYLGYNINTDAVTEIQGGTISSVMQGVAILNTQGGPLAKTNAKVSDVDMHTFTGTSTNPDINFHAGVYTFTTTASTAANGIELAIDNVSIDGTGVPSQSSGGVSFADFSGNTSENVQTINITNSSIINNANRGVDARGKVNLSISGSTLSNNGHTAFGTGGNLGFTIHAQKDATVTAENNFISLPTGSAKVYGLFTGLGTSNLITAHNNSILRNGNTNPASKLAQASGTNSINATCNWWGTTVCPAGEVDGNVTVYPFITNGTDDDLMTSGFQPVPGSCVEPSITATVTGPVAPSITMTSGNSYDMTICSGQEVTTSRAFVINNEAANCASLRVQTVYTTTISTLAPTVTYDIAYSDAYLVPSTTISPENHDGVAKDIVFVSTPYYDANGNGEFDAGDVAGGTITFTLTVQSLPVISNTVTSGAYSQVMTSGGSYTHSICHDTDITTSIPTLAEGATGCGILRINTQYISTLPNIPSTTLDATFDQVVLAGPQTISPNNTTGSAQTITFITKAYYDLDNSGTLTAGDIVGDITNFVLTIYPIPTAAISGTATVEQNSPITPVITFTGAGGTRPYKFTYNVNGGPNQTVTTPTGLNSTTVAQDNSILGVFTYNLVSAEDANGCAATILTDPPLAVIQVVPAGSYVDLAPSIARPDNVIFALGASKDGYVQFTNGGDANTAGPVTFRIYKPANFNLTVDNTIGTITPDREGTPVAVKNNSADWTITWKPGSGGYYEITSNVASAVGANSNVKFGFTLQATGGFSANEMKVEIIDASGGDNNKYNNVTTKGFNIN